jgi:hypothetical protein
MWSSTMPTRVLPKINQLPIDKIEDLCYDSLKENTMRLRVILTDDNDLQTINDIEITREQIKLILSNDPSTTTWLYSIVYEVLDKD